MVPGVKTGNMLKALWSTRQASCAATTGRGALPKPTSTRPEHGDGQLKRPQSTVTPMACAFMWEGREKAARRPEGVGESSTASEGAVPELHEALSKLKEKYSTFEAR